jgi:hypothetical protein
MYEPMCDFRFPLKFSDIHIGECWLWKFSALMYKYLLEFNVALKHGLYVLLECYVLNTSFLSDENCDLLRYTK